MKVSRKWLNEFVSLPLGEVDDRRFAEAMTVSGSKVELTEDLSKSIKNVKAGRVLSLDRHPDSDHMFVLRVDMGRGESVQIVTGAWNVHVGDLVPVALDGALLPGGKEIRSGVLRGVESQGMLCSLKELELTIHDFPYAGIRAAAILGDYRPADPEKPAVGAAVKAGDQVFGGRIAAAVESISSAGANRFACVLDLGGESLDLVTDCQNLHRGDLAVYDAALGALCSPAELGAKSEEFPHCLDDGILILHEDLEPGDELLTLLGRDDHVVEFEITPNRPDCLCMIGLAREAAVTFDKPLSLHEPEVKALAGGNAAESVRVVIEDESLCRRYVARLVKNVKIGPSPAWMRERLRNAGMRPINNLVDITNYVMLEYGQPMHAFDFSCVEGGEIHVRRARAGESLRTLDGTERALDTSMLCICDKHKPVGVAGVMGGENSEIVGDTAMVLFESANFDGPSVRRTATALGMRTDASSRFEKGLDAENAYRAVQRACELVELLEAGEVVPGVVDVYPGKRPATTLMLEPEKINALLGTDVAAQEMARILTDLGFGVDGERVTVPSWRGDVEHYSDLAEEVARFYGYDRIPVAFTGTVSTCGGFDAQQDCERRLGQVCRSLGLDEIITYSFISPSYYDKIRMPEDSPLRDSLRILNPLGEDTSIMRTSILPSMLEILSRNYNYRNRQAALYEIGRIYLKRPDGLADEPKILSLGAYGPGMDFFTLKGWVEALLQSLGTAEPRFVAESNEPAYHPGRCARVLVQGRELGVLGQIHPLAADNYGLDTELYCAELSVQALFEAQGDIPVYEPLPRFPAVSRDLALVCDERIPAGELRQAILESGGAYLSDCRVFDVYTGSHIAPGKKSVAFTLTMRAKDQTLTDEHAEATVKQILTALERRFGAVIR